MLEIDLNCDLGESFGAYTIGMDEAVIPYISSANVACGFHAGDPVVMAKTVRLCHRYQVGIGAHPGFLDLIGFGRRNMQVTPSEVRAYVLYQIGALKAFCKADGTKLRHVKPHGALYNMAGSNYDLAIAICEAVKAVDPSLKLMALSGSQMIRAAKDSGLSCISEVFADRAYQSDGTLVPRGQKGAMVEDEELAIGRIIRMVKDGVVSSIDGTDIAIQADSVCVHGDGLSDMAFVKRIRESLTGAGIMVRSF